MLKKLEQRERKGMKTDRNFLSERTETTKGPLKWSSGVLSRSVGLKKSKKNNLICLVKNVKLWSGLNGQNQKRTLNPTLLLKTRSFSLFRLNPIILLLETQSKESVPSSPILSLSCKLPLLLFPLVVVSGQCSQTYLHSTLVSTPPS